MTQQSFVIRAQFARRLPDPNFSKSLGLEHHIFLVNCRDLPVGLPLEANARRPNTRKQVYRQVRESLEGRDGEPGSFHLKNKGIVIVATAVRQKGGNDLFEVSIDRTCQGILDGGHTYTLICDANANESTPEDQYVFVHVRTGIPHDWVPEISQGLNTSVQVQEMSLQDLAGHFVWLKEAVREAKNFRLIAWSENDPGRISAKDLIAILYLFKLGKIGESQSHPIAGYEKKSEALKLFDSDPASFKSMRPILSDILYLHDYMSLTAADLYNSARREQGVKGRGGGLSFVKYDEARLFEPFFAGEVPASHSRLEDAALYPMLAAFRVFLRRDPVSNDYAWNLPFSDVVQAWEALAGELMQATIDTAKEVGRSNNAIGKSRLHWDGIFRRVENYQQRLELIRANAAVAA